MPDAFDTRLSDSYLPAQSSTDRAAKNTKLRSHRPSAVAAVLVPAGCVNLVKGKTVAVVGGGFAGLMAARVLCQQGLKVSVFEARSEVGGRVLSNKKFSPGRITEVGAELVGTFHRECQQLALEYGVGLINRTEVWQEGLNPRTTLDKRLDAPELEAVEQEMRDRVLIPISREAATIVDPSNPWNEHRLEPFDRMSVASAINRFGVTKKDHPRLWTMLELLLVNDNLATLEAMNYLGLLCLVKGGQEGPGDNPPMGYWDRLELFRCADGCQSLAFKMAAEIRSRYKADLKLLTAVTDIDLVKRKLRWRRVQKNGEFVPGTLKVEGSFDYVVFAIPPSVWNRVSVKPEKDFANIGVLGMGPAVKFISDMDERFWIKEHAMPTGGSLPLGQVWEGTDGQTWKPGQRIQLSVFAGGRIPPKDRFVPELKLLYPGYKAKAALFANWPEEPFIKTGYAAPRLGQIFTVGQALNKPFHDRMVFAGEHTQMNFFGYMEGALVSGKRAAETLIGMICGGGQLPSRPGLQPQHPDPRIAEAEFERANGAGLDDAVPEDEVLGKDERVLVGNTLVVPNRWVCAVEVLVDNPHRGSGAPSHISAGHGTGVLIGPRHVLTAAHVVKKPQIDVDGEMRKVDVAGVLVSPARNGDNDDNPFGKLRSKKVLISKPYRMTRRVQQGSKMIDIPVQATDDYALIILDKDVDALAHAGMKGRLGYWGQSPEQGQLRRVDPGTLKEREIIVTGYPGDRCGKDSITGTASEKRREIQHCVQHRADEWASTQWTSRGSATADESSSDIFHTADTYAGQSGAPIYWSANGKHYLVGIHADLDTSSRNKGVRVTRRMLRELCEWMNADAGHRIASVEDDGLVVRAMAEST